MGFCVFALFWPSIPTFALGSTVMGMGLCICCDCCEPDGGQVAPAATVVVNNSGGVVHTQSGHLMPGGVPVIHQATVVQPGSGSGVVPVHGTVVGGVPPAGVVQAQIVRQSSLGPQQGAATTTKGLAP
eukprot:g1848.t1